MTKKKAPPSIDEIDLKIKWDQGAGAEEAILTALEIPDPEITTFKALEDSARSDTPKLIEFYTDSYETAKKLKVQMLCDLLSLREEGSCSPLKVATDKIYYSSPEQAPGDLLGGDVDAPHDFDRVHYSKVTLTYPSLQEWFEAKHIDVPQWETFDQFLQWKLPGYKPSSEPRPTPTLEKSYQITIALLTESLQKLTAKHGNLKERPNVSQIASEIAFPEIRGQGQDRLEKRIGDALKVKAEHEPGRK